MSIDGPILSVVDLTYLNNLELAKSNNSVSNQPVQEALKMSKKEVNLTTGLIEIMREIKGIKSNVPCGLKELLEEYGDYSFSGHDIVGLTYDTGKMAKDSSDDQSEQVTEINDDESFNNFRRQLNDRLVNFYGKNEYVAAFFTEAKFNLRELHYFVPVLAYVCWSTWQQDFLVDYKKLSEVIPSAIQISPAELLTFVQIAQVVYDQCRNNGQK